MPPLVNTPQSMQAVVRQPVWRQTATASWCPRKAGLAGCWRRLVALCSHARPDCHCKDGCKAGDGTAVEHDLLRRCWAVKTLLLQPHGQFLLLWRHICKRYGRPRRLQHDQRAARCQGCIRPCQCCRAAGGFPGGRRHQRARLRRCGGCVLQRRLQRGEVSLCLHCPRLGALRQEAILIRRPFFR